MAGNRRIFEEVGTAGRPAAEAGAIDRGRGGARLAVRAWLLALFALVAATVAVGGLTRLTDSGLSITEWAPLAGAVPPLGRADWEAEFALYRLTDEFRLQNRWMTLDDFKAIYWWEWAHRQLGRAVGLAWAVGFSWFLARRQIPAGWTPRLLGLGALGGLQGAVGWWMVASGVARGGGMLDVASYRLAIHLGLAFVILGLIAWYACLLGRPDRDLMQARRHRETGLFSASAGLAHLAFLQVAIGALVAGIDAGRSHTDWPLMGGRVFPAAAFALEPWWRNLLENPGLVQFAHRAAGYLLLALALAAWLRGRRSAHGKTRLAFGAVLAAAGLQVALGIVTVLHGAPWQAAILHQLLAVVLWVLILRARFLAAYPVAGSVRGSA